MLKAYWKQFAASATGFAYKYRRDVFYRTGWNVLLLQVGFATVLLAIVVASLSLLYDEVIQGLVNSIAASLAAGTSPSFDSISIATSLEYEKQKNIVLSATGVLIAAAVFSWLITRIALTPTRNALETQKQFVGNIAHELRTPLSIIKTNTEVALFNKGLDRDTTETLKSNVEELDRISDIINNLLSMNALLRPEKMVFANVDMGVVADRVVETLTELAAHKDVTFDVRRSGHRSAWGNATALEQVLMNVAKNALNYTPAGGHIHIVIEPNYRGQIEVRVEDTGTGITEKDLEHIFEPFYRGDQSRNRKAGGGSGLGLAIVSELVKLHKGSIGIKSRVGEGTTVTLSFPPGHDIPEVRSTHPDTRETGIDFSQAKSS